jgi:antitoxin HicB
MSTLAYPVKLKPDPEEGGFTVFFPDLPEAITQGENRSDALAQATDCLAKAIAGRIRRSDPIPPASRPKANQAIVPVPPLIAAKAALYVAMREAGLSNVKLAKRLGCDEKDVRRLLDPRHRSRITALERALAALGKKIIVVIENAA